MKNKIFKKFGAIIMALVIILTSIGSMSTSFAKKDYFDPDDLYWEFPYRCQDDAIEFEAFKKPITVEAESRELSPIIKSKELQGKGLAITIKIYNEQAGNRIIYSGGFGDNKFTLFYGDKIDVSYYILKPTKEYKSGKSDDLSENIIYYDNEPFPYCNLEVVGTGYKIVSSLSSSEKNVKVGVGNIADGNYYMQKVKTYSSTLQLTNSKSKKMTLTFYNGEGYKIEKIVYKQPTSGIYSDEKTFILPSYIMPGKSANINFYYTIDYHGSGYTDPSKAIKQIIINNLEPGFKGEVREAKKEFPNEAASGEKAQALAKAKEDAKTEIKAIKDLTAEQISEYEKKVDEADSEEAVKAIVEEAKKQAQTNKASEEEKAQALAKAKEDAKTEIKAIKDLTAEQIAEFEKKVDEATSEEAVKAIVEEAKKQAETNKASEEEKAKQEALEKAKEEAKKEIKANKDLTAEQIVEYEKKIDQADSEEAVKAIVEEAKKQAETNKASEEEKAKQEALEKAKEEALKKAKEEELAKELAKKNENDPAYQKDKLNKLLEEAKRVRHPSEELEAAIDEGYDILFDKYARLEDYKYAIEKIERILQNRRDTRRNRFKLDVDDLNEKDTELTGKTGAKWYIDVYNGKKCILSGQANYKGDFSIEIKKGKIKAKDKLKVVATDPQDDKKYKEVEIEVTGKANEAKEQKGATSIDDLLQADGSNSLSDLAVFPVGKNFYNVVQNNQKTTVYMDVTTFISGNRTMLPMRYIAYALGFNVEYDSLAREAIFSNTENSSLVKKTIRVNIDTGLMRDSDGRIYASDVRPVLINNRIHASIANIARMFNASQGTIEDGISQTIEWDNARKAVYVFKNVR